MRTLSLLLAAGCLLSARAFADTDILQVIPEKSLVVVVARDGDAAEAHFREMVGKFATLHEPNFIEKFMQLMKVRPTPPEGAPPAPPKDSVIVVKGPMALVGVTPAPDVKGVPLALVVQVTDYKKLLDEIGAVVGAVAPDVTPDGSDLLKGPKNKLFLASFPPFAVISSAEYVVRMFKGEAGKDLAKSSIDSLRETLAQNDVVVYANLDEATRAFPDYILWFRQEKMKELRNAAPQPGALLTPEKKAKMLGAAVDLGVKAAQQVDALVYGFTFTPDGARVTTHVQAVPDTEFAKLAAKMKSTAPDALRFFDVPALAATAWHAEADVVKEILASARGFLVKGGFVDEKAVNEALVESHRKVLDALAGQGAVAMAPAADGKGLLRLVYVLSLKPDVDVRDALRDHLSRAFTAAGMLQLPVKVKGKIEAGVELYRDTPVDRVTLTFEANPDAAAVEKDKAPLKVVEAVLGPEVVVYIAQVQDKLVYTIGYAGAEALKAHVDRVLDAKAGDLAGSEFWRTATAGLPPAPASVTAMSPAEIVRAFIAQAATVTKPELAKLLQELAFDKPSATGICVSPTPKGLVIHLNIPIQEMINSKEVILKFREAKALPAPAPTPAPAPAPDGGVAPPPAK